MVLAAQQTLNKIIQDKDYSIVKKNGLDSTYFHGYEAQFNFIDEHYKKFGNVPDLATFLEKFPNWVPIEVNETDEYLLDRLYEDNCYHRIAPFAVELGSKVQEDSRAAFEFILHEVQNLRPHTVVKGDDIIAQAMERYEKYLEKQQNPESNHISTGIKELDDVFGGWDFGDELVTVVARTNVGKSWILLKFLTEAWKQGYAVGLYSGEMNQIKLGYRFDALYQHLSNWALVQGTPVDGYLDYIKELQNLPTPFRIVQQKHFGGKPTVQNIRNFIEETGVKIMGIDQFSLMEDGRATHRDPTRLRLCHIAEDLFLLSSEYKIPIIGLAQANREATKKDGDDAPSLENIKESDDIAANSSKCIGLRQTNFGLVMDIIKNREGKVGAKLLFDWDINFGQLNYIPSANDAAPAPVRQQATQQVQASMAQLSAINPF